MDYNGILEYQADRYPYLFIDAVTGISPLEKGEGYKNLTMNEWFFPVHFPGDPCMPGYLQAEALTQLCALTVLTVPENKGKRVLLLSADNLRLYRKVRPGDRLDMEAELLSYKRGIANGRGKAYVRGKIACSVNMSFTLADDAERRMYTPKTERGQS